MSPSVGGHPCNGGRARSAAMREHRRYVRTPWFTKPHEGLHALLIKLIRIVLSDLGVLGGHYAGSPPALFRHGNTRSFRAARDLRITWPHGPRSRQCHCDKSDREYRPSDGICFEPSIECVLVLRGQLPIVKCYVALSHDTPPRLVSDECEDSRVSAVELRDGCNPLRQPLPGASLPARCISARASSPAGSAAAATTDSSGSPATQS
jgi:hypothetical protein